MAAATLPILPAPHRDARHRAATPASMPGAAVRSSARSAPSSTCRAASRATARRTTSRRSSAPTPTQGITQVLRHRRQFRPQQELGADPRPADRAAREGGLQDPPAAAGRHAVPPHSGLHREGGARRLQRGVHRAREHQSGVAAGTKKRQNKIWEYREMLQAWRKQKVMTWAGYILGFPTDTPESIARDIEIIKQELPIDILEFFCLTPLPGSEDHKKLFMKGVPMDPDMNKYDLEHVCTSHADHVEGAVGRRLSRRLGALLHRRACRDGAAPRARVSGINLSQDRECRDRVLGRDAHRGRASAAVRPRAAQVAHAAPPRHADREPVRLLSAPRRRVRPQCLRSGPRMCGAISRSRSA